MFLLVTVFRSYVIRLSQPRRQQLVCEYWCRRRTTRTCSLRERMDWPDALHLSVWEWV